MGEAEVLEDVGTGDEEVRPAAKVKLSKQARRLLQPAGCREYMRRRLAEEFEGIVDGFVKVARTGSVPHVKLATELLRPTRKGTSRKKSAGERLLERLTGS